VAGETKVTRIKASDSQSSKTAKPAAKKTASKQSKKQRSSAENVGYFKGAWLELKQVRWPTRRATWGLTIAVLVFSLFFIVLISLLDIAFKALFELIIV
jgi:preprotein translocase SecE subunit